MANGVVGANELGHAVVTATTAEGYTASCDVYVVGTALRVYYKGLGQQLHYGDELYNDYNYNLVLIEDHYYESGLSKEVNVSNQVSIDGPWQIKYSPQSDPEGGDFGILYFDSSITAGEYMIQFHDALNMVSSDVYTIRIK